MRELQMNFYNINPSKNNTGFKFVLWAVADSEGNITYDWGFADWLGTEWDVLPAPEGYEAKVVWWANTLDPEMLLKEESKIIRI